MLLWLASRRVDSSRKGQSLLRFQIREVFAWFSSNIRATGFFLNMFFWPPSPVSSDFPSFPPHTLLSINATRRNVIKFEMSRAITRVLLTASLTISLFLHNGVPVHAIPTSATDTTDVMAPKPGNIFKSALNALSQRGSTTDILNSNACSNPRQLFPGAIGLNTEDTGPFWMEKIKHQGKAPFNPDPEGYKVFRNVKVRASLTDLWRIVRESIDILFRITVLLEMVFTMIPLRSSEYRRLWLYSWSYLIVVFYCHVALR